ncbi:MAG: hypothetical protein K5694_01360 [Bacilli bacterium]|nr:hypothetical protein [Bacilli bacterium]
MKNKTKIYAVFASLVGVLTGIFAGIATSRHSIPTLAEEESYVIEETDVSKFKTLLKTSDDSHLYIDEEKHTLTANGGWDSCFSGTNQFDTLSSSYYLKAHCYNENQGDSEDGIVGFNIYYDNITNLNFYLHWMSGNWMGSIAEAVFLGHVNGVADQGYSSAILPDGDYITRSVFTDVWTDFGGWTYGEDRHNGIPLNLRIAGSVIMLNKGFDMTLYVDRTIYKDRLVDVMQIQVDAFMGDGVTPRSYYTPKYAVDAFTCPLGVESKFAHIKPQIGFWNNNVGDITYSEIEFGHLKEDTPSFYKFKQFGQTPLVLKNGDDGSVKIASDSIDEPSFYIDQSIDYDEYRNDLSANLKSDDELADGSRVGFVSYYDEDNYVLTYLTRDSTIDTIDYFNVFAKVGGQSESVYQGAINPWADPTITPSSPGYVTAEETTSIESKNGGFVTDAETPCGVEGNFNKFQDETKISLSTGFNLSISRVRMKFLEREIDQYQLAITALDNNGVTRTWYTPAWCMDAFTYPNGSSNQSLLHDVVPQMGIYVYGGEEVTFSNFAYNRNPFKVRDDAYINFGSHEENGWILSGSDLGANWTLGEDYLLEDWSVFQENTYKYQVNALTSNESNDFFMSSVVSFLSTYGDESYAAIYPYYLNDNNFLAVYLAEDDNGSFLKINGVLQGILLGGEQYPLNVPVDFSNGLYLEIGINGDTLDLYIGEAIRPSYSLSFTRDEFAKRKIEGSKVGFGFYNASGAVQNVILNGGERNPKHIPQVTTSPKLFESGIRRSVGYVGIPFDLPHFSALNALNETIDVKIAISNSAGVIVKEFINESEPVAFTSEGIYEIKVTATDEWGLSASPITYQVNVMKFVPAGTVIEDPILWQTIVVISIFSFILLITVACAVLLFLKNKKEARRAAELNQKNREKNNMDREDD